MSSLYIFIRTNDIEQVKELLTQGVKPDVYGLGEAIIYNYDSIIDLLLPYLLEDVTNFPFLLNHCIIANNKGLFEILIEKISPNKSNLTEAINKLDMTFISTIINHGIIPESNELIQLLSIPECNLELVKFILSYIIHDYGFHIDLEEDIYDSISLSITEYLKEENIRINIIKQEIIEDN